MLKVSTVFIFVFMVMFCVGSDVRADDTHKLLNSQEWPKTWDAGWTAVDTNLKDVRRHLNEGSSKAASVSARNAVIAIRALQNLSRLEKYREAIGNKSVSLQKAQVLASRLANALQDNKSKLAETILEELNDTLDR